MKGCVIKKSLIKILLKKGLFIKAIKTLTVKKDIIIIILKNRWRLYQALALVRFLKKKI